jgi:dipeptidyl aminopeptidase/acylaminoacyl peptidase
MKTVKVLLVSFFFIASSLFAQEIPINELFYPVNDFGLTLSPSGNYMASVKKFTDGYAIMVTDVKAGAIKSKIPMGEYRVYNLNWITENRLSYEQIGVLFAINIDGTETQQLMSVLKKEKKSYSSLNDYYNNLQFAKMINVLDDDFEHILIETRGVDDYPVIYKLNIYTGEKEEIENGKQYHINGWLVDRNGNVRFGIREDDGEIRFFTKNSAGKWESKNELKLDMDGNSFIDQKINFLDFDYDQNVIYIASCVDNSRWRILTYDVQKKSYVDVVLEDSKYDIGNPFDDNTELLFQDSEEKLIGIRYEREKPYTKWFSEKFQEHQKDLEVLFPEYYADIFDWNDDGSIVLARLYSDAHPGRLIAYDTQDRKIKTFCIYARELLDYNMSSSQLIKYPARDGYEIEGYLNLPSEGGTQFPLIVIPHGGPWARDYWRYDPVVQFFANQGYGVLRMNFRGSSGYGADHLLSGVRQISDLMIDDIADGVKWAIDQEYADSNRICIYGHSYGGYAALQSLVRYPDVYCAAVAIGAPTDIKTLLKYLKKNDQKFAYEFWKTTIVDSEDENAYLKSISPIYNIENITHPVFLFHGEKDEVVPVAQTESFVKKAKKIGKTFEYKIIQDEDHSISANRNMEFVLRKALQFFRDNEAAGS